ncbi:MAG TPA: hypothetical protein VIJ00_19980 [Nakamurella sp.]
MVASGRADDDDGSQARSMRLCGPVPAGLPVTGVAVSTLSGPIHTETVVAAAVVTGRFQLSRDDR